MLIADWETTAGGFSAICLAASVVGSMLTVLGRHGVKAVVDKRLEETLEKALAPIKEQITQVRHEVTENSGNSLKDQARKANEGVMLVAVHLEEYRKSTDRRLMGVEREIRRLWDPYAQPPTLDADDDGA